MLEWHSSSCHFTFFFFPEYVILSRSGRFMDEEHKRSSLKILLTLAPSYHTASCLQRRSPWWWSSHLLEQTDLTKGNLSQTKFSQVSSLQKCMINRADSSVFRSESCSQECQCVIRPPSIIVMGLSIGSLWQTLRNKTWLQDRLHRLTRSAVWSFHKKGQAFSLILSTTF